VKKLESSGGALAEELAKKHQKETSDLVGGPDEGGMCS
jgi:hypothetical protein